MARPSRIEVLMGMATLISQRGTCSRLQVGALVHREGRVLVTGYNGAPKGLEHCSHLCDCGRNFEEDARHNDSCNSLVPCLTAQHAERNCIDWAARYGIRLEGADMVTTDSPCAQCAGSIINAGILSVTAHREYRDRTGVEMLVKAGIALHRYAGSDSITK